MHSISSVSHKKASISIKLSFLVLFLYISLTLWGCSREERPEKTGDLDFTIVSGSDIPQELKKLIHERKKSSFELTFSENSCLFVVKGYGTQKSGGYSIKINEFYQAKNTLVLDTELIGPKKDQKVSDKDSYPYIVLKTEYREEPITFY